MKAVRRSVLYFFGFLGAVGTFGFSILSIVLILYILTPNFPGNKYSEKLPTVIINSGLLVASSYFITIGAYDNLRELNSSDQE